MERLASIGSAERPRKIDALTGLRFLAAAMIVLHHSRGFLGIPRTFLDGFALNQGVSFFFVLSGFILSYVYPSLPTARAKARFFIARVARVWPAHLFAFLLVVTLGMQTKAGGSAADPTAAVTAANLTMTHAWVPTTAYFFSYNAVSWSISTEFFFYLAFPFLLVDLRRSWIWKLLICLALLVFMVNACAWWNIPRFAQASPQEVNRAGLLYIGPVARLAEFFLGMLVALVWKHRIHSTALKPAAATALEVGGILVCGAAMKLFSDRQALVSATGELWAVYLHNCGGALAFAFLIYAFARQQGAVSRLCAKPLFVLLGEISFSIYLLHQILLRWTAEYPDLLERLGVLSYAVFWIALLATSWAAWRFAELPARRMILRLAPAA